MLTAEQVEIRDLARQFAEGELRPHAGRRDAEQALEEDAFSGLAELGFFGMLVPAAAGGLDFDLATYALVLEELAWGDPAVALTVAIHNGPVAALLARRGDEAQKEAWLPRLASGEVLGAFALAERTNRGTPTARAARSGDAWTLRGRKAWVTNGARAGLVLVFARTGEHPSDVGCFLVDPTSPGYRPGERATTMGLRASETVDVELDGVEVPSAALLGPPDEGLRHVREAADLGRLGVAAVAVGIARAALEHAAAYALGREQFGRPIADFDAIQAKLADMAGRVESARALTHRAAAAADEAPAGGLRPTAVRSPSALAALARITASEAATWVADEAVQIFGGYGYMREYPVEKLLRDAKGTEIIDGTNEELRRVVARDILGTGSP